MLTAGRRTTGVGGSNLSVGINDSWREGSAVEYLAMVVAGSKARCSVLKAVRMEADAVRPY